MTRPTVRSLVRHGYFPAMFLGVNGLAFAIVAADLSPGPRGAAVVGLLALALVASFALERVLPYERAWNDDRGDVGRDVLHFAVNEGTSLVPLLAVPALLAETTGGHEALWPTHWPFVAQALLAIAGFDLGQTLFHRLAHAVPTLWRLHEVHHSVDRLYGLNGIMKHPLYQALAASVSIAPLVALGMPRRFALVIVCGTVVQLLLQHSNVDYRTGPVRRVVATAEVHRFHHLRGRAGDVNFALFFSAWDRLFGWAFDAPRHLTSADVGLERPYPRDYLGQLLAPFRSADAPLTRPTP